MNTDYKFNPLAFVAEAQSLRGSAKRFVVSAADMYPAAIAAIVNGAQSTTGDGAKYNRLLRRIANDDHAQARADALAECGTRAVEQEQEVIVGGTPLADGSLVGGKRERRVVTMQVPVLPCEALPPERLVARAFVLEVVRKWFTNELHGAAGRSTGGAAPGGGSLERMPIEVYFPNESRFKLGIPADALEELERRV